MEYVAVAAQRHAPLYYVEQVGGGQIYDIDIQNYATGKQVALREFFDRGLDFLPLVLSYPAGDPPSKVEYMRRERLGML